MFGQHRPDYTDQLPHGRRYSLPMRHDFLLPLIESCQIAVQIIHRMLDDHIGEILPDKRVALLVDVSMHITFTSGFVPGDLQSEIRYETLWSLESLDTIYGRVDGGRRLDPDPIFSEEFNGLSVTIGINPTSDITDTSQLIADLDEKNKAILTCIKKDSGISARSISEITGISINTVERRLKKLTELGILKREGSTKSGK